MTPKRIEKMKEISLVKSLKKATKAQLTAKNCFSGSSLFDLVVSNPNLKGTLLSTEPKVQVYKDIIDKETNKPVFKTGFVFSYETQTGTKETLLRLADFHEIDKLSENDTFDLIPKIWEKSEKEVYKWVIAQ